MRTDPPEPGLILASTSPYRRALLERLGVPFIAMAPRIDEDSLKNPALGPRALAESLALAKAKSLDEEGPDAVIIGSDQVVTLDGQILGKPGDANRAIAQLLTLSGRSHEILTAVAVWDCSGDRVFRHTDRTTLTMRRLDRDAVTRYVEADRPIDCAGSYKLESRGITLFSSIESADQSAITGLPLIALTSILREIGFAIP